MWTDAAPGSAKWTSLADAGADWADNAAGSGPWLENYYILAEAGGYWLLESGERFTLEAVPSNWTAQAPGSIAWSMG